MLAIMAATGVSSGAVAQPAANQTEAHLVAAKAAAGFDFPGLLARICVAPQTAPGADVAPPPPPSRESWYTEPAKVFDNLSARNSIRPGRSPRAKGSSCSTRSTITPRKRRSSAA